MCGNLRDKFKGMERCRPEALGGRGWEYTLNKVLHLNLAEPDGVLGMRRVMEIDQRLCPQLPLRQEVRVSGHVKH